MTASVKPCQGYLKTELRVAKEQEMRKIVHYWYNTWPDHGALACCDTRIHLLIHMWIHAYRCT